jgi:MFS family permease
MQKQSVNYKNVLLPTFFYYISYFMILSLNYQVLLNEVCKQMNESDCTNSNVSAHTSYLMTFISLTLSFPPLLLSGIYSSIADKYGRKVVIIMPIVGIFVKILTLLYVNILHPTYFFPLYLFSSFTYGILGSQVNFNMGIFTYTADTTHMNVSYRSKSYSIIELCMIVPKILGFFLAGILSKNYGFIIPLLVTLILTILSFIFACIIPESFPRNADVNFKLINTYYNLKLLLVDSNIIVRLLSFSYFLFFLCLTNSSSLDILYFKNKFGWDSDYIGYYETIEGVVSSFSMLLIYNFKNIYNKLSLVHWAAIGYFFRTIFWSLMGFANSVNFLYVTVPFLLLTGAISPYTRSVICNNINKDDQAKSFTAFSTLQNLPALIIPLLNVCYTVSVKNNLSWIVYQIMSFLVGVSFMTTLYVINTPEFKIMSFRSNNRLLENKVDETDETDEIGQIGKIGETGKTNESLIINSI